MLNPAINLQDFVDRKCNLYANLGSKNQKCLIEIAGFCLERPSPLVLQSKIEFSVCWFPGNAGLDELQPGFGSVHNRQT